MGLFTSNKERRLWFMTLATVVAIYSTLGLAGKLAQKLIERNQLDNLFFWTFLFVVITILASAWKRRAGQYEIWAIFGIIAVYVGVIIRMGIPPAERTHLFEYGLVAVLIYQALSERKQNGQKVFYPSILAIVITLTLGWIDECLQAFLPNRVFDPLDMVFNTVGVVLAIASSLFLEWVQKISRRKPSE